MSFGSPGRRYGCISQRSEVYSPYFDWMKPELRELFDLHDPDIEYVIDAIRSMKAVGCDVEDPEVLVLAIKAGHYKAGVVNDDIDLHRQRREERRRQFEETNNRLMGKREAVARVYYARLSDRVKIGYSYNVRQRMWSLSPEELLASEPGSLEKEAERHRQFAHLRTHGEWFRYEGELVEHVEELRRLAAAS